MIARLLMTDEQARITWTTRINLRPSARDLIRILATEEKMSVATVVGLAVERYVTMRSTA